MPILSNALPNILQNQMCIVGPCTYESIWNQKFGFFTLDKWLYPKKITYLFKIPRNDEHITRII